MYAYPSAQVAHSRGGDHFSVESMATLLRKRNAVGNKFHLGKELQQSPHACAHFGIQGAYPLWHSGGVPLPLRGVPLPLRGRTHAVKGAHLPLLRRRTPRG